MADDTVENRPRSSSIEGIIDIEAVDDHTKKASKKKKGQNGSAGRSARRPAPPVGGTTGTTDFMTRYDKKVSEMHLPTGLEFYLA